MNLIQNNTLIVLKLHLLIEAMNLLWTKERLQKIFSKDSLPSTAAHASGDASVYIRCCRLCGGEANLCHFSDTYVWEGTEERYDQLLFDCFGFRVIPAHSMICERCVRQLRLTQRFRALVYAAFARPPSEFSTNQSQLGVGEGLSKKKRMRKSAHELLKKTTHTTVVNGNKRRKLNERKTLLNSNIHVKRMNIACTVCKHKYPMIVPFDGWKNFVCSRCKKKSEPRTSRCRKCDVLITANAMRDHLEIHTKADLRRKSRLCSLPKKPSQITKQESFVKPKQQCSLCSKNFSIVQHLNQHVESAHKNVKKMDFMCGVCNKNMYTKDLLDRHMRTHTGEPLYQCDICMKVFKGKRAFQTHYLKHEK